MRPEDDAARSVIEPVGCTSGDLGYFNLEVLQTIAGKRAYFVSRLNDQDLVLDIEASDRSTWSIG